MSKHLQHAPATHVPDEMDMELADTVGDDDSDSGLEDLIGAEQASMST